MKSDGWVFEEQWISFYYREGGKIKAKLYYYDFDDVVYQEVSEDDLSSEAFSIRTHQYLFEHFSDWRKPTEAERGMFELDKGYPFIPDELLKEIEGV